MQRKLTIFAVYDPPPVPIRAFDWQAWVDGQEERLSVAGPTPQACLRELADEMEDQDGSNDVA